MLGTFGTSQYNTADDFRTHKDYLTYMYGNTKGIITRSVIDSSGAYSETFAYPDRLINRNSYHGVLNVYTSMNTFLSKHKVGKIHSGRKVENLKRLNALYLDLDCYKIGMSQEQVLYELEEEYFGHSLPVPTFVINSGRGLYLIWKIDEDRNALPRWRRVENYLLDQCREFNADPQAVDAARILRVPFSINGKNGETVSILRFHDVKYTLHEIISEYNLKPLKREKKKGKKKETYPFGEATARQRQVAQWQASEHGLDLPDFGNYQETFDFIRDNSGKATDKGTAIFGKAKTITSMLEGRINDLFKLFAMRKGVDCCREYALFLCRLWTGELTGDYGYALDRAQALNKTFDVPFDEKYVAAKTKSAETKLKTGRTYQYGVPKLIEVLNISEKEQEKLDYLCMNPEEKTARKKLSNRKAYLSRLEKEGRQTKGDAVKERREKIATLIAEGKSKEDICAALHISERTYSRDKATVIASGVLNDVKAALRDFIEEGAEMVKEAVGAAVQGVKQAASAAKKIAAEPLAPNFQQTNYSRTSFGCPACAARGAGVMEDTERGCGG